MRISDWSSDVCSSDLHGYRTGGFSLRSSTQLLLSTPFKPETVDDVELGLKADWRFGDSFLRTNFAAFISDFKDIQRVQLNPNTIPLQNVTTNAATDRKSTRLNSSH